MCYKAEFILLYVLCVLPSTTQSLKIVGPEELSQDWQGLIICFMVGVVIYTS